MSGNSSGEVKRFDQEAYFDSVRNTLFGGSLSQQQVEGQIRLGSACAKAGLNPLIEQTAYVLASVYHETAKTMHPIEEYYGSTTRYAPWYGRGEIMLTWEENYLKQQDKLGAMVKFGELPPDFQYQVHDDWNLALVPETSTAICVWGMRDGDFTGKGLDSYIKPGSIDYVNARRIVNGTDKASQIAGYADIFERALRAGSEGMDIPVPPPPPVEGEPVKFTVTRVQVGENINYTHPDVRIAQSILTGNGYLLGEIDGIAGPKFTGAVSDFQATVGLAVTGAVDAATWIELET